MDLEKVFSADQDRERCFIISAIGDARDPACSVYQHMHRVIEKIISPAMKAASISLGARMDAYRSDMRDDSRDIWHSVLEAILSERLLIAVLTYDRPNVWYELGIAHSAARPVVVLKDDRVGRQFDTYHIHMIDYTWSDLAEPEPARSIDVSVERLAKAIVETYRKGENEIAFDNPKYSPLNKYSHKFKIYDKLRDVSYADWSALLHRAERSIDFVGTTLLDLSSVDNDSFLLNSHDLRSMGPLTELLMIKVLFDEIDVCITIMHEDNPALASMLKRSYLRRDKRYLEQVREEIAWSTKRWIEIGETIAQMDVETLKALKDRTPRRAKTQAHKKGRGRGSFRLFKNREGTVKFRLTATDKDILATPIFYNQGRNGNGPALWVDSSLPLYTSFMEEIENLRLRNGEASAERYRPQAGAQAR